MAKLFLSYSRKDAVRAQRFCDWLEREGHDVWRDNDDIGGGASFSVEIEKALKDCDAVLVLWSAASVQSAWVRDEAAFGRDKSKLIPFTLDGTEPPLGFRQFQTIDIAKWRGRGEPSGAERIRTAIARVTAADRAAAAVARPPAEGRHRFLGELPRMWVGGGVLALAAAAVAIFLWQRPAAGIAIAVVPSPQSPDRAMAADYANVAAADMAAFLPRRFDHAAVIGPDDAARPGSGYRIKISTDPHGAAVNASVSLSDEDGSTTLWSKSWTVADAQAADLRSQVSASASRAALCLADARGGSRRLSQPALGLYLSGCTALGDDEDSNTNFEAIFERLTKLAPDFGPGWGYLALSRSWTAEAMEDSHSGPYAAAAQNARAAIAKARKLNPNSALTYDAEYHLVSNDPFQALQVLDKGAEIDPDYPEIQMHLGAVLLSVGRMSDSVQAAQRAVELDPGSTYARSQYILALVYSGQFEKAKADIAQARKRWPNDPNIDFAEYGYQYRYGDPRIALKLLPSVTDLSDAVMVPTRKVIAARIDPTPAKIDEAIAALKTQWFNDPHSRNIVLLALGNFNRVDEAYQLMADPKFQPFIDKDVLFRPDFAAIRADPRFMPLAARLGLVRYWRQSGYWPDFCTRDHLPYDCRTEAAKYK